MAFMGDPLLGALTGELLRAILDVMKTVSKFKPDLERLKSTLETLLPQIEDLNRLDSELDLQHRGRSEQIHRLKQLLNEGKELVFKCSKLKSFNFYQKYRYSKKFLKLDESLVRFFQVDVQGEIWFEMKQLLVDVEEANRKLDRSLNSNGRGGSWFVAPELPSFTVGLNVPLQELKMKLFKEGVTVVGLCAPGGCGKTTLASKLCNDQEVKGIFKENIFFLTVSSSPNFKAILQRLFKQMDCGYDLPEFQNDEDAVKHLKHLIKLIEPEPILLVLDDVWSESYIEKLSFGTKGYKMLVTSRTEFQIFDSTYSLKMLSNSDAMALFCHSALPQDESYDIPDEELVNKIVHCCKGFPLVLKVIAHSLRRQPARKWQSTAKTLSKGGTFFELHSNLLDCLATSLDDLSDTVRECFLDLGSFPEDQRIPAAALVDIWVELYELDDEDDAYVNLLELSARNLITLVEGTRNNSGEIDGNFNELAVVQHDLLRDLAIYQGQRNLNIRHRKRLIMNRREENLPKIWREHENEPFNAHIVSIHTEDMSISSWPKWQSPETKVLVLNFSATNYCLPQFMEKMDKLKVLIITNLADQQAKVNGLTCLNYLSNLKRIRLEKVSFGLLDEITQPLKNLQKISLVMCDMDHALNIKISGLLPNLTEINIDYCDNLKEFPQELCNARNLKTITITNCHSLSALPEEIGQITDLEVLRLHACTELLSFPDSIRKLWKLRFLDISDCANMEKLPEGIGELRSLRKLDMRRCSRMRKLPRSVKYLDHLKDVICDEETKNLWEPLQFHLPKLNIRVPESESWVLNKLLLLDIQEVKQKLDRCLTSEARDRGGDFSCVVPELPCFTIGMDVPLQELKMKLFRDDVTILGLCGPGGYGKTTLAAKLCRDEQIKGTYKENIYFLTISSSPDFKTVLQRLFRKMGCKPDFQDDEDAVKQLEHLLRIKLEPILLVLDDVWSDAFIKKFLFRTDGYKVLVTSRTVFKVFDNSYSLENLSNADSMTLFNRSAFSQDDSYVRPDKELVNKLVQRCKGSPLFLNVIAFSLRGQPAWKWKSTERKLSTGGSIFDNSDLLDRLATTLDDLDDTVRECFLDLGSFPEDERIPAAVLIDIWMELYELDEYDAYVNLHELSDRFLVTLLEGARNNAVETDVIDVNFNELSVVQHDLLRELTIYEGRRNRTISQSKRLIMNRREENLPETWRVHENESFDAHLVSIHTGDMSSSSWPKLQSPETKVLVLNFSATNYCLPQFMEKMDKLKVLIITNLADHQAEVNGLTCLNYLSNLKRIRLEKVSFRLLNEITQPLKNLQKISLVMCDMDHAMNIKISGLLPNLTEINIDYCDNLLEFPRELCNACNLKTITITNCHSLSALPEEVGQITDLEVLRLHACAELLSLPDSIRKLWKLRLLDISDCANMKKLPEGIGELRGLRMLDMRRCSRVRKLPRSAKYLVHLKDVICDEETKNLWEPLQFQLPEMNIRVPKEINNLNWLG